MKKIVYLFMSLVIFMTGCSKNTSKDAQIDEIIRVKVEKVSNEEVDQIYEFATTVDAAVKNFISSAGGTRIEKYGLKLEIR